MEGVRPEDTSVTATRRRKQDHLALALSGDVGFATVTTGLERLRVRSRALPERDLAEVDLGVRVLGRDLAAPLLVSCMTGGVSEAGAVNASLAIAAQHHRVAFGLGSGRIILEDDAAAGSFAVRHLAPDALLLANLGAVQLHHYDWRDCRRLVERCEADALVLHLNAVQEAVQPGGDTDFSGLARRIADVAERLQHPVIVKEVGFGLGPDDVALLAGSGVAGLDVAGAGGTNWARVEGARDDRAGRLAAAFADWGWPTAVAVERARRELDRVASSALLIGSGGLRDGLDALKVLCLGADLAGLARGLLAAGAAGPEAAVQAVGVLVEQLRVAAWAAGAGAVDELGTELLERR